MNDPFELAPQTAHAVMQAAFDGTDGNAETLRHFALGELFEVAEKNRVAEVLRELRDERADGGRALLALDADVGPRSRGRDVEVMQRLWGVALPAAADAIHRDGEEPPRKRLQRIVSAGA